MSQWNTQLPILVSWARPDREILPRPSTHPSKRTPDSGMVVVSWTPGRKYCTKQVPAVVFESITLSAHPQLLPPVGNNEHQTIDDAFTDQISYDIQSLETIDLAL